MEPEVGELLDQIDRERVARIAAPDARERRGLVLEPVAAGVLAQAAILIGNGEARVIRERETVDHLLAGEP